MLWIILATFSEHKLIWVCHLIQRLYLFTITVTVKVSDTKFEEIMTNDSVWLSRDDDNRTFISEVL